MNTFTQQLNALPVTVQDYLLSDYGLMLEQDLSDKYELTGNKWLTLETIVSELYFKSIAPDALAPAIEKTLGLSGRQARRLACDLLGERLLPVGEYFGREKIIATITSLGGKPEEYEPYLEKMRDAIAQEKEGIDVVQEERIKEEQSRREELKSPVVPEISFDPEQEKKDSIDVFRTALVDLLEPHENDFLEDFNFTLIELMNDDEGFKRLLEQALYANEEALTGKPFALDGKKAAPTVGNWLKDFIRKYGTANFTNVTLTGHITNSENGKVLSMEEKKLVAKLFMLYRNVKFFPESVVNLPPERWEIIPADRPGTSSEKVRVVTGPPKTAEEKDVESLRAEEEHYAPGGLERLAIEEEIGKKQQIEDLKIQANRYKPGTLERRALEDEIKRLGGA